MKRGVRLEVVVVSVGEEGRVESGVSEEWYEGREWWPETNIRYASWG